MEESDMDDMSYEVLRARGDRVEFEIRIAGRVHNVYFQSSDVELELNAETLAASMLYSCMANSTTLVLHDGLDDVLRKNIDVIQAIARDWFSGLQRVPVIDGEAELRSPGGGGCAAFFSGGLDSFYTLEKQIEAIDSLIFVHGFDVELDALSSRRRCSDLVLSTARHYDKKPIQIETNLRSLIDQDLDWGYSHAAAFAAVCHLLRCSVDTVFLASSCPYGQLFPWGSHPLLDPLWSSSTLKIVHDGCEASRIEKARAVCRSPFVMRNLRVCWKNPESANNCGVCEKCIRTMINLEIVGNEDYQEIFGTTLDRDLIAEISILKGGSMIFARENLAALQASALRPDLQKALRDLMRASDPEGSWRAYLHRRKRKWAKKLRRSTGRFLA
jgi:hypothetical protein